MVLLFLSMSHQTFAISNRANFKSEKIWTRVLYVGPSMDLKTLKNKSLAALSKIKKIPEDTRNNEYQRYTKKLQRERYIPPVIFSGGHKNHLKIKHKMHNHGRRFFPLLLRRNRNIVMVDTPIYQY